MNQKKTSDFYDMYKEENTSFAKEYTERTQTMGKKKTSSAKKFTTGFFIILFICGLGAALIGTIYFSSFGNHIDPLSFEIQGPQSIKSSENVTYEFPIKNRGTVPLTDLSLTLEFPQGFHFDQASADSDNVDHTYWKLQAIKPNEAYSLKINGTLIGNDSEDKAVRATLHYRIGENGTEFVSKKDFHTQISSQLVPITLSGPQLVEPSKDATYTLTYGDIDSIGDNTTLFIKIQTPKEFTYQSTPAPDKDLEWSYDVLKKNFDQSKRSGTITLKGTFSKDATGDFEISAQIGTMKNSEPLVAQEQKLVIRSVSNPLTLTMSINNSTDIKPISLDSEMQVNLQYENKGTSELNDVHVVLSSDSPLVDWSSFKSDSLGLLKDQTITWTKNEYPAFEKIKPGDTGKLTLTLKTKDPTTVVELLKKDKKANASSLTLSTSASMHVTYNNNDQEIANNPLQAVLPINSDTRVYMSAVKTDASNQITIQGDIENTLHEIKDIKLTIPLNSNVSWTGKFTRSAGDITYDDASKSVIWTLNRLPLSTQAIHSTFTISLPANQDITDKSFVIAQPSSLQALDNQTQGNITYQTPAITLGDSDAAPATH